MRNLLLLSLSTAATAAALAAAPALAADLPYRAAPPAYVAPLPVFTWTGFYVGVNAGGAFRSQRSSISPGGKFLTPGVLPAGYSAAQAGQLVLGSNNNYRTSFEGGVQAGYNFQYGALVYGVEADIDYISRGSRQSSSRAIAAKFPVKPFNFASSLTSTDGRSGNYIGTVRGRLGYAFDRFLPYVTGGLAYGDTGNSRTVSFGGAGIPANAFTSGSGNRTRVGYAVGAGVEYAFTNNITAKAEYLFTDLGRSGSRTLTSAAAPGYTFISTNRNDRIHQVRVGLNYKF